MTPPPPSSPLMPPPTPTIQDLERPFLINLMISGALAMGATVLCALLWGVLAYFTNSIFLYAAIGIGVVIAWATTAGFRTVTTPIRIVMFLPAIGLTLISVALGDLIFYTLHAMREFDVSLIEAALAVLENAIEILSDPEEVQTYIFGGLGALLGVFSGMRRR